MDWMCWHKPQRALSDEHDQAVLALLPQRSGCGFAALADCSGCLGVSHGAGAVLVFFRSYWRLWAILFPEVWRWSRPLRDNLTYWAARKIRAGLWRIRTDWNDLRRAIK
jgi:hypothetical protein